jgi:hypothetical protein
LITFVLALATATAAPPSTPLKATCADVVTPEALVCRALEAQKGGNNEAAAQAFEEAAKASSEKDPKSARMYAAAGNMWIAANQPGKADCQWKVTRLPSAGKHYYFVKVTQADDNSLWSAPVWITTAQGQ